MTLTPSPALTAAGFHDAECAAYRSDLPVWVALADTSGGPVVDVGAGTGRVALTLASAGHAVQAVDIDPALLAMLDRRAAEASLHIHTWAGDLVALGEGRPADAEAARLLIVPMQTFQLLAGPAARLQAFASLAELAAPGAELVLSIVAEVEPFDSRETPEYSLPPDTATIDGWTFESTAVAVLQELPGGPIAMHRERVIIAPDGTRLGDPEPVIITLDGVTPETLAAEATASGWEPAEQVELPETDEHAGSTLLLFTLAESPA